MNYLMMKPVFNRADYYSQIEAVKLYKISVKAYKQAILANNFHQVNVTVNMGDYTLVTIYISKVDIDGLGLKKR